MKQLETENQLIIQKVKQCLPVIIIFCLAAFLLYAGLENTILWQDEAETALLGKNIYKYGIPKAYDGRNIISTFVGMEFDKEFLWIWSSWGDKYIAALSMWIFGTSTLGARFLFVVFGFASAIVLYVTVKQIFPSHFMQRITVLFYITSLPYLLMARQCRYYSLVLFFSLLMFYFLLKSVKSRKYLIGFIAASFLLFHSNYFFHIGLLISLIVTLLIIRFMKQYYIKTYLLGIAGAIIVSVPGLFLYRSWQSVGSTHRFLANFINNLIHINDYMYPLIFVPLIGAHYLFSSKRHREVEQSVADMRLFYGSCLVFMIIYVSFISYSQPDDNFRYLIPLLPLCFILLSLTLSLLFGQHKIIIALFAIALIMSNFFHMIPKYAFGLQKLNRVTSYFVDYVSELRQERKGPLRVLNEFLQQNAKPSDIVIMTYGRFPIIFYTDLEVHGGGSGYDLTKLDMKRIKWVVIRHYIRSWEPGKDGSVVRFVRESLDLNEFDTIILNVPDSPYEHREDPYYFLRSFKNPQAFPPLVVLRRR